MFPQVHLYTMFVRFLQLAVEWAGTKVSLIEWEIHWLHREKRKKERGRGKGQVAISGRVGKSGVG